MKAPLNIDVVAWGAESMYHRLDQCRFMLYAHGYLSSGENDKVRSRIKKEVTKQGFKEVEQNG